MVDRKTVVKRESSIFPLAILVTVGFLIAKCTGALHWPWLWVLAPLWITAASYAVVLVMIVFLAGIIYVAEKVAD